MRWADITVTAADRPIDATVEKVAAALRARAASAARGGAMSAERRVRVALGARSYDVIVGAGLVARAGELLAPVLAGRRAAVVTDDNVAPLYLAPLRASLEAAGVRGL